MLWILKYLSIDILVASKLKFVVRNCHIVSTVVQWITIDVCQGTSLRVNERSTRYESISYDYVGNVEIFCIILLWLPIHSFPILAIHSIPISRILFFHSVISNSRSTRRKIKKSLLETRKMHSLSEVVVSSSSQPDQSVHVWDLRSGTLLGSFKGLSPGPMSDLCLLPSPSNPTLPSHLLAPQLNAPLLQVWNLSKVV